MKLRESVVRYVGSGDQWVERSKFGLSCKDKEKINKGEGEEEKLLPTGEGLLPRERVKVSQEEESSCLAQERHFQRWRSICMVLKGCAW